MMKEIRCPLCGIYSNNIAIIEKGYQGKKCEKCNMIFISPRPAEGEIIELYRKMNSSVITESNDSAKRLHARHNLSLIKRYIGSGSILEIGAGAGYFLKESKRLGFDVCAIELNDKQARFINDNLEICCETTPLNEGSFNGKKFDLVYHSDVISHFYDPTHIFNMINFKLKDKGFVIFETGNYGDVDQRYYSYIPGFQYPFHLFFFSENSIRKLLDQTGFNLIKIYHYSLLPQLVINRKMGSMVKAAKGIILKNTIEEKGNIIYDAINGHNPENGLWSKYKQLYVNLYRHLSYQLRYSAGSIYFRKGDPQTIIVVAQKRGICQPEI